MTGDLNDMKSMRDEFSLGERYFGMAILRTIIAEVGGLEQVKTSPSSANEMLGKDMLRQSLKMMELSTAQKILFWFLTFITCGIYYAISKKASKQFEEDTRALFQET